MCEKIFIADSDTQYSERVMYVHVAQSFRPPERYNVLSVLCLMPHLCLAAKTELVDNDYSCSDVCCTLGFRDHRPWPPAKTNIIQSR